MSGLHSNGSMQSFCPGPAASIKERVSSVLQGPSKELYKIAVRVLRDSSHMGLSLNDLKWLECGSLQYGSDHNTAACTPQFGNSELGKLPHTRFEYRTSHDMLKSCCTICSRVAAGAGAPITAAVESSSMPKAAAPLQGPTRAAPQRHEGISPSCSLES